MKLYHLVEVYQQTEHQEHNNLEQPSDSIEEGAHRTLVHESVISDNQASDIDCQVAIALDERGERERKEYTRQEQYRIERGVVDIYFVDDCFDAICGFSHSVCRN